MPASVRRVGACLRLNERDLSLNSVSQPRHSRSVRANGPDPVDVHVGRRVKLRRVLLDMSQTQLAGNIGLTFQQVQKYEKGANRISASMLHRLAQALRHAGRRAIGRARQRVIQLGEEPRRVLPCVTGAAAGSDASIALTQDGSQWQWRTGGSRQWFCFAPKTNR